MNYFLWSIILATVLAILVIAIEFVGWNIQMRNKKRRHEKSIEENNEILQGLIAVFDCLKKEQYMYENKRQYTSFLKDKNIEEIQHAKEVMDASLAATSFWGILFTVFNTTLSKIVSVIAEIYAHNLFGSDPKAAKNIENILLISLLLFVVFFIYTSLCIYQRDKYIINILQDEIDNRKDKKCNEKLESKPTKKTRNKWINYCSK